MGAILLADDSPHAQRMGEHILREEGFPVIVAADGSAALAKLAEIDPDLVIADAFLPGGGGFDLCRQMKAGRPHLRLIFTAGPLEPLDIEAAKQAGCDAVVRKPFEASEMLAAARPLIQAALGERRKTAAPLPPDAARLQDAVEAALLKALPSLTRDITEKVLLALKG